MEKLITDIVEVSQLGYIGTPPYFMSTFMKGNNSSFSSLADEALPEVSTVKGKNLLQKEQILSFKSRPTLRKEARTNMAELLPLKVYPSSFTYFNMLLSPRLDMITGYVGLYSTREDSS